jgi:hypothetical protein
MTDTIIQDDFFSEKYVPKSNWFKFEKVGDTIAGVVVDIFEKQGQGDFPDQKVFAIKTGAGADETLVPIKKTNDYHMTRTKNVKIGDKLGFKYEKDIPPTQKGKQAAKSIAVFVEHGDFLALVGGLTPKGMEAEDDSDEPAL